MSCDCYRVGGPFIGADPDCPRHGYEAQESERTRVEYERALEERLAALEARVAALETPPRCMTVWNPGVVTPPNSKMPTERTRCFRKPHPKEEPHGWTQLDAEILDMRTEAQKAKANQ